VARGSVKARYDEKGKVVEYVVRYDAPSPDGKRRQRQERRRTKKAAEDLLTLRLQEIRTGEYVDPTPETVGAFLDRWLGANPDWRGSTRYQYGIIVEKRLKPHLGGIGLSKLSALQVAACYQRLKDEGYAASSIHGAHAVLHGALDRAVDWRLVARNVADRAKLPEIPDPESAAWSGEEARAFLAEAGDGAMAALWRLGLDSGMRPGELLGLRWADVDWNRSTVAVRRTVTTTEEGKRRVGDKPKRERSRRTIVVGPDTVAALRQHRARQAERRLGAGAAWRDEGLVFDRGDGGRLAHEVLADRFDRACEAAGVPRLTPHGLRHTCATLLLAAGVHPKIVQERLGHATISETMDRYSHVLEGMQQGAAETLAGLLGGGPCAPRARGESA